MQSQPIRAKFSALSPRLLVLAAIGASGPALGGVIYHQDFEGSIPETGVWSSSTTDTLGGTFTTFMGRFGASTLTLDILANETNAGGGPGGGGGGGGGDTGGSDPFNIQVHPLDDNRQRVPYHDQGGGGGGTPPNGSPDLGYPKLDLGGAVSDGTNPPDDGPPRFAPGSYSVHFDLMLFDSWDGAYELYGPDSLAVAVNGQTLFDEILYTALPELNFRMPDEQPENVYSSRWADLIYRDIELTFDLTEETDLLRLAFIGGTTQSVIDESWGIDNILVERLDSSSVQGSAQVPVPGTLVLLGGGIGLMAKRRQR